MKRFWQIFAAFIVAFICEMAGMRSSAAIVFPQLPNGCPQMTSEALAGLVRSHRYVFPTVHATTDLRVIGPFRDYMVRAQSFGKLPDFEPSLAPRKKLPERLAREICHDYLSYMVLSGTNMVQILTVGLDDKNRWDTFGAVYATYPPDPMWVVYQKARQWPQVKRQDYEFRFLMVDLKMRAVWLHGKTDDIIIPYPCGYATQWKGYQPYSVSGLAKLLQ